MAPWSMLRGCWLAAALATFESVAADEALPLLGATLSSTWRPDGVSTLQQGFRHDGEAADDFVYTQECTAELAIDGNVNSPCCSSEPAESSPWLSVQLEQAFVSEVWIYHRKSPTEDFSGLLEPFEVFVVDTPRAGGRTETFCGQV